MPVPPAPALSRMQKPVALVAAALVVLGALAAIPAASAAPSVSAIDPSSGSENGGTQLTLTGDGFAPGAQVCFDAGCSAALLGTQVNVVSSKSITVNTPAKSGVTSSNSPVKVPVVVKNLDGTSTQVSNGFSFTNTAAPTTTGIAPNTGTSGGGALITLTGTNFETGATPTVTFGGVPAPVVSVDSTTSMTVVTPGHSAGAVSVIVSYMAGDSNAQTFTYTAAAQPTITSASPATGTSNGGNTVTITGNGFAPGATVCFMSGATCTQGTKVVVSSPTTITTLAPAMAGASNGDLSTDIKVTNVDATTVTRTGAYTFLQAADPKVTGLFPNSVPTVGGTVVNIGGTGFAKGATVCVVDAATDPCSAGLAMPVLDVPSSTTIFAAAPAHDAGTAFLRVVNPDSSVSAATPSIPFTYVLPMAVLSTDTASGPANGGTTITLTSIAGGFPCAATYQVYFGAALAPSASTGVCTEPNDSLVVVTPGHAASSTPVDILVLSSLGPAATLQDGFTYTAVPAPTVGSLSSTSGSANGGEVVTIMGTNFACPQPSVAATKPTVLFGSTAVPAADVTCTNGTTISVKAPPHVGSTSALTVTVVNPSGQSGSKSGAYTYQAHLPTVSSVTTNTVSHGTQNGGDAAIVSGTNFDCTAPGPTVTFQSTKAVITATDLAGCTPTAMPVHTPGHAAGAVTVTVTNPSGESGAKSNAFTFDAATAPTLVSVSPSSGNSLAGTTVTLTGAGFACTPDVKPSIVFGGVAAAPAEITCGSSGSLTVKAPPHSVGGGAQTVSLTNAGGQGSSLTGAYTYTASAGPTITSLAPATGSSLGGTMTTITGTGFYCNANQPKPTVTLGTTAVPSTDVTCSGPTSLGVKLPAHTAGPVNVVVSNPDGQGATLTSGFRYLAAPPTLTGASPATGSKLGGTFTTLAGTNFIIGGTVLFDGTDAAQQAANNPDVAHLLVKTPAHPAGAADVTYLDQDGQAVTAPGLFTFGNTQAPLPTSISPTKGSVNGGSTVTITGGRFQSAPTVCFGGTPGDATCPSENQATSVTVAAGGASLTAVAPAHVVGTVPVTVINGDGEPEPLACGAGGASPVPDCSPPLTFTFLGTDILVVPTVTSVSPAQGVLAGGTAVTITGTHFATSGTTTVTFGGTAATNVVVASATSITATTPAHAAGAVDVVVTTGGQTATLTAGYTYTDTPTGGSSGGSGGSSGGSGGSSGSSGGSSGGSGSSGNSTGGAPSITDAQILAANKKVVVTVKHSDGQNQVTWTLPASGLPGTVAGVQLWRSNSPYTLVKTFPSTDSGFRSGSYTDVGADAKATTKYLVTMYYGASQALGFFTNSTAPTTTAYPGIAAQSAGSTTSTGSHALPTWAIVLIAVGVLFLIVLVAVLIARGRNREGQAAAQGYAWQETTEQKAAEGEWQPPAEVHQARCPSCGTSFTATGTKPIVTVCPGCGKKGILR